MKHFDDTQWTDYARGFTPAAERAAMGSHLDAGCRRCGAALAASQRLMAVAEADAAQPLPAGAMRSVKALLDVDRPERRPLLDTLRLELRLDSALVPAVAGVREGESAVRQLLFESPEYALDVQIESAPQRPEARVTGQLLTAPSATGVGQIPTYLVADERVVATGLTSELGQFALAAELGAAPELWLLVADERSISVSLA